MRARNMAALTADIKRRWPGVTIYGVGDEAHKLRPSDHNEDDTPGSRPAQTDADSNPEHRAIDVMVGPAFTKSDGDKLVAALLGSATAKRRLHGIIWHGSQWWRSNGWARQARTTDQHNDHVHISGHAADDENAAGWPMMIQQEVDPMATFTDAHAATLTLLGKLLPDLADQVAYTDGRMEGLANGRERVRSDLKGAGSPLWLVTAVKALETQNAALAAADEARDNALRELLEQHQSGQLSAEAVVAKMGEMLTGAAGTPSTTEPTS